MVLTAVRGLVLAVVWLRPAVGPADAPRAGGAGADGAGPVERGVAAKLIVTERGVAKHTASIFTKLGLEDSDDGNRRVPAVLAYLGRDR